MAKIIIKPTKKNNKFVLIKKQRHFMNSTPPFLKSGDSVGIVAPARKISVSELKPAIETFTSWGLEVLLGENIFNSDNQFSGTDEERAADFQKMLNNTEIKAIFCARGGYGTVRIIDRLDFSTFIKNPKWIVGYSDVTVIHSHIHNLCGIETLHAAMPINFSTSDFSEASLTTLKNTLFGKTLEYTVDGHPLNNEGCAKGMLVGGNLSVLYSLLGSESDINTKNKILFIEDLDEYLYHIDRMMMCLKRAGKLEGLSGIIIGGMNKMNDNAVPFGKTPYEIINDVLKDYSFPTCYSFPSGHIKDNRCLIMGRCIEIDIQKSKVNVNFN